MRKIDKIAAILGSTKERIAFHFAMYAAAVGFGILVFSFTPSTAANNSKYALPAKHLSDSLRAQYPTLATNP